MEAEVTHFEDATSHTGEIITRYMIRVQILGRGPSEGGKMGYYIPKRYSDFKNLYDELQDFLPADYKFPNKSIFNNSAQFTKQRRMKGFDEMLKLLLAVNRPPELLKQFLEINEHQDLYYVNHMNNDAKDDENGDLVRREQAKQTDNTSSSTGAMFATNLSNATCDEIETRLKLQLMSQFLLKREPIAVDSPIKFTPEPPTEAITIVTHQLQIKDILIFGTKSGCALYGSLIVLGLVDISSSDYSQILFTLITVVVLCGLLRKLFLKHQKSTLPSSTKHTGNEPSTPIAFNNLNEKYKQYKEKLL